MASGEKPRVHTHYLKGTVACGQCGQLLSYERTRGRLGDYYEYFYCLGRQSDKNGCTFRAVQVSLVEQLVEDHWAQYTLSDSAVQAVREQVLNHLAEMMPNQSKERQSAQRGLLDLEHQSRKLLQAHYADAVDLEDLRREQLRIATQRAMHEQTLSRNQVAEDRLRAKLDDICRLLSSAERHYVASENNGRRDLNQGLFKRLYIDDDEVVGADLMPAFHRLLSESLADDLVRERKQHLNRRVRTNDHLFVDRGQRIGQPGSAQLDRRPAPPPC